MDARRTTPADEAAAASISLGRENLLGVLWESAAQAFVRALMVMILGSIAAGILGGLWTEMMPSPPPHLAQTAEVEAPEVGPTHTTHSGSAFLSEHRFLVIFGIMFIPTLWLRLAGPVYGENGVASRTGKVLKHVSENWFGLVVGNAFGAAITAAAVGWAAQWTWSGWLLRAATPYLSDLGTSIFGTSAFAAIHDWFAWYGSNQYKLTFWVFYLAAVVDDLGLPNFKTLGRWLGRKVRHRRAADCKLEAAQKCD